MKTKVMLSELGEARQTFEISSNLSEFTELAAFISQQKNQITAKFNLKLNNEVVSVKGHLNTVLKISCDRCLTIFDNAVDTKFDYRLLPNNFNEGIEDSILLNKNEMEIGYYDKDFLDLNLLAEEQLILDIQYNNFCKEDCLGLCVNCHKNLNEQFCECYKQDEEDSDSINPFSVLKN